MGFINIEQNRIIKIFSVVFLPPTLVASSYGMNFEFMPELKWSFGYHRRHYVDDSGRAGALFVFQTQKLDVGFRLKAESRRLRVTALPAPENAITPLARRPGRRLVRRIFSLRVVNVIMIK